MIDPTTPDVVMRQEAAETRRIEPVRLEMNEGQLRVCNTASIAVSILLLEK